MIYADSNIFIRILEGAPVLRDPIEKRLAPVRGTPGFLLTSRLSLLECRCKPMRMADQALVHLYDGFFASAEVAIVEIDHVVIDKATQLRASLNVRTPDAIHLASAILAGASAFLTGDLALSRCTELNVEIL
jgi:predicted nucleic acid-binding protein